ncbi:MAG: hypothetical protein UX62_C0006G0001 [Microgenomates group bacterium GW2011_GWA2_46_7]|nr:MAG: hypothetical protein UX62_C0006G0001 [Microgenomates group bacterium GW2011_GWA2_46_7]
MTKLEPETEDVMPALPTFTEEEKKRIEAQRIAAAQQRLSLEHKLTQPGVDVIALGKIKLTDSTEK